MSKNKGGAIVANSVNLYTIGFTKKTAKNFFELLKQSGVTRVIDTRLNNVSQLAGFAKKADLEYFLKTIGNIDYIHRIDLAPSKDILDEYKKQKGDWETYETKFLDLLEKRQIEKKVDPELIENACLLCSEAKPHHCHRRLVAEYLNRHWGNIQIHHL
ncbi:MAG: DUF488 family protein [Limnospira sp.]|jgi:uncharacterized protein (DUF488 family)